MATQRRLFLGKGSNGARAQSTDEVLNIESRPVSSQPIVIPPLRSKKPSDAMLIAEAERLLEECGYDPEARRQEKLTEAYRNRKVLRSHDHTHKRLR